VNLDGENELALNLQISRFNSQLRNRKVSAKSASYNIKKCPRRVRQNARMGDFDEML
jgi:hypothetical protein